MRRGVLVASEGRRHSECSPPSRGGLGSPPTALPHDSSIPYFLIKHGVLPSSPSKTQVLYWVMWPATGMLVAGGLAALALRWRLLIDTFRSLRSAKISSIRGPLSHSGFCP